MLTWSIVYAKSVDIKYVGGKCTPNLLLSVAVMDWWVVATLSVDVGLLPATHSKND